MKILVLESNSGLRRMVDPNLFPEGFAMLKTFVEEFKEGGFEVITTLHPEFEEFKSWIDADNIFESGELDEAIGIDPDAAFVIAPEGELELINRRLRRNDIPVLGPDEKCIGRVGNKWDTYRSLKARIPQPETWNEYPETERHLVSKPKFGAGSEKVEITSSKPDEDSPTDFIFQKEVNGVHASCCILMGKKGGRILSVNGQRIVERNGQLEYRGGSIPIKSRGEVNCSEMALKVARKLNVVGYSGIDMVFGDENYFIELNPRATTSFVGLARVLQENLGELLVNTLLKERSVPDTRLEGCCMIKIPRACEQIDLEAGSLRDLEKIPEVIAPPYLQNERLEKNQPAFLIAGTGKDHEEAEKSAEDGIRKSLELLGVDISQISLC